jgi:hypothetical protein
MPSFMKSNIVKTIPGEAPPADARKEIRSGAYAHMQPT